MVSSKYRYVDLACHAERGAARLSLARRADHRAAEQPQQLLHVGVHLVGDPHLRRGEGEFPLLTCARAGTRMPGPQQAAGQSAGRGAGQGAGRGAGRGARGGRWWVTRTERCEALRISSASPDSSAAASSTSACCFFCSRAASSPDLRPGGLPSKTYTGLMPSSIILT